MQARPIARRAHKKSKLGCRTCKIRKVKVSTYMDTARTSPTPFKTLIRCSVMSADHCAATASDTSQTSFDAISITMSRSCSRTVPPHRSQRLSFGHQPLAEHMTRRPHFRHLQQPILQSDGSRNRYRYLVLWLREDLIRSRHGPSAMRQQLVSMPS